MKELILTILSYVLAGGVGSAITAFVTINATRRGAFASALSQEEEAEQKSIENIERWRKAYGNIIVDLTERLNHVLKRYSDLEFKYEDQNKKYNELENKYADLERKYDELERKYNGLRKNEQ